MAHMCHADASKHARAQSRTLRRIAVLSLLSLLAAGCTTTSRAAAADSDPIAAMKKLAFMAGTWTCPVLRDGKPLGMTEHLTYRFFAGGQWMAEHDDYLGSGKDESSTQVWGFDPNANKLVAYQFMEEGVSTKTVLGWQNGEFVSRRDDNGYWVTVRVHNAHAFDWLIQPPDKSTTVVEACTR